MREALSIILCILSIALIALVLLQSKGADLGGFLGGGSGDGGVRRTRRGVEAIMHRLTIWLSVAFFAVAMAAFFAWA